MKPHLAVAALALTAATLAACGGGGGGGATPFIPLPASASSSAALSTSTTTAVSLAPISNGSSANVTLPAVSASTNATLSLQSSLPSGAPQPQAKSMAKSRQAIGGSNINVLDYVLLTVDSAITISQTPAFSFTLAQPVSGDAYIAFFDTANPSNGWNIILGPGKTSGNTVSFASQTLVPSLALVPKDVYVFALLTASGVATPTPVPTYPGAAGSTYAFTGTQSQSDTYTYPSPSPLPSTSVNSTVTEQITVGASPFPSGSPAVADLHEVLTVAAPLVTQSTTTDAWYGLATGSAPGVALFGAQSVDGANNTMTHLYTTPQTVDQLPETNGAKWTNSPAGSVNATFVDGSTLSRVDQADGSFSETTTESTLLHHYTFILAGNADGSGSYSGTGWNAFGLQSLNVSAPSAGTITVSILPLPTQTNPSPSPIVLATPAAWFTPSGSLYTESDVQATNVAYPASCNVPAAFGFTGTHVTQTIERIDPVIGTDEHVVNDTYLSPVGPVCMTMSDTLVENYDWLNDTFSAVYTFADFSGTAVHTEKIQQSLTLQSASILGKAQAKSQSATLSPAALDAARAQFGMKIAQERHKMMRAMVKRVEAAMAKGGAK